MPALAAMRNIFAMLLLGILVAQSIVLFRGVIHEEFRNRVTMIPAQYLSWDNVTVLGMSSLNVRSSPFYCSHAPTKLFIGK
jgi:hypothetical protein